ncbi:MAG: hypothetical protein DWQ04_25000 [Chloroflexi bacterium]|nr:MAG: hypothetical protein DWQ04_25000 [Chloroflexota bacterium]
MKFVVETMTHTLFPTVAAMLAPDVMSEMTGLMITAVSQQPLSSEYGRSGSRILLVTTNHGQGPSYILKRVSLEWDWLMRSTKDTLCRSVTLWQHGILDQMPPEIEHGVVACSHDGDGWAILMENVGDMIVLFDPFTEAENAFFINAMAAVHAQFWQNDVLDNPDLGLCELCDIFNMFNPRTARVELNGDNNIPRRVIEGWELSQFNLPTDVFQILQSLLDDATPFCDALAQYPHTLVHGDWRHANQACAPGVPHLYLLDWQLAVPAPPVVDLARYLITNSPLLPVSKDAVIEIYRHKLAARLGEQFSDEWWEPQLALSLLGGFLQDGWAVVLKATNWRVGARNREQWRADLVWWSEWVRAGAKWL